MRFLLIVVVAKLWGFSVYPCSAIFDGKSLLVVESSFYSERSCLQL